MIDYKAKYEAAQKELDEARKQEPAKVTNDMVYSFCHAISDSSISEQEFNEVKIGLSAAISNLYAKPFHAQAVPQQLTDEKIREIRNRAKLNSNNQIDPILFARDIERAMLASAPTPPSAEPVKGVYWRDGSGVFTASPMQTDQYLYLHPPTKPQRITEQDAREISSHFVQWLNDFYDQRNATISKWLDEEGRTLLAKLNENREPDYKARAEELLRVLKQKPEWLAGEWALDIVPAAIAKHEGQ